MSWLFETKQSSGLEYLQGWDGMRGEPTCGGLGLGFFRILGKTPERWVFFFFFLLCFCFLLPPKKNVTVLTRSQQALSCIVLDAKACRQKQVK